MKVRISVSRFRTSRLHSQVRGRGHGTASRWQTLTTITGPTDVLIKLNATGICHSDIHFMLNDWALPKMSEMGTKCAGHEGAGVIVKVGDQVKTLKPGMRAGFKAGTAISGTTSTRLTHISPSQTHVVRVSSVAAVLNATARAQSSPV